MLDNTARTVCSPPSGARASPVARILPAADAIYEAYSARLACWIAFLIPLKLALCYIPLLPALVLWLLKSRGRIAANCSQSARRLFMPLFLFAAVASLCSLFGFNPLNSLVKLGRFAFFACLALFIYETAKKYGYRNILLPLIAGQSIAALHSVLKAIFPASVPDMFVGVLRESGQLALTLVMTLGLIILPEAAAEEDRPGTMSEAGTGTLSINALWAFGSFGVLTVLAFAPAFGIHPGVAGLIMIPGVVTILSPLAALFRHLRAGGLDPFAVRFALIRTALPLLACALLVNLKRGPWAGVFIGGLILLALYCRKYLVPLLLTGALVLLAVEPVRNRIVRSPDHFFISGGRAAIWDIGAELSARYPLGIGYENGQYLRNYSREIPQQLTHFHNNFLNIAVETGWLAFGVFLWWMLSLLAAAFRTPWKSADSMLAAAIGCALLSWQIAGTVEYNFGDSEVLLLVFMLAGIMGAVKDSERSL